MSVAPRAQAFNLFHHAQYEQSQNNISGPSFGEILNTVTVDRSAEGMFMLR
jgi:hypothetical protein